ncbi:Acylamino-acid-releasing enzyme [Sarcoptes scabiei]|uniref:acylaminoacyl-peptidase n=1 Tax=Sarcoptes scabiei TaxID=52283 RepID=A0A834RE06_SARSC|nr:Acylamino-acid-releasing enzyme [Sarcoptes scabiei]
MAQSYKDCYAIEKLKSIYNRYSFEPIPNKITFLDNGEESSSHPNDEPRMLKIDWRLRDTFQVKAITFQQLYCLQKEIKQYEKIGLPDKQPDVALQTTSLDGHRTVLLLTNKSDSTPEKQFLEIYDRNRLIKTIDVKVLNEDLKIIDQPNFSSFVLDPNGNILLCVAQIEKKSIKDVKDFTPSTCKDYDIDGFEYRQSWGEKFSKIFHSQIVMIDLDSNEHVLLGHEDYSLCRPFFHQSKSENEISIGCVGLKEQPYKLGLIYCTNRNGCLFSVSVKRDIFSKDKGDANKAIVPEIIYGQRSNVSIESPRVYYSRTNKQFDNKVIFLERNSGGPHNQAARLQLFDFETKSIKTIVSDELRREVITNSDGNSEYSDIGPLFTSNLPSNCFSDDGRFIFLNSNVSLARKSFSICLETNTMKVLDFSLTNSTEILDIKSDWICLLGSSINHLPNIYIGRFNGDVEKIDWITVDNRKCALSNLAYEKFCFESRYFPGKFVTGLCTSPIDRKGKVGPMIIIPHGGPHSNFCDEYYQSLALYTELGLKTCLINYVGSTGVDRDYVDALLGRIGETDVQDLYDCISLMIKNYQADPNALILNGGSHGGFLVTNISGQHPELNFCACIARNPVIDVSIMFGITDIPDWNVVEALGLPGSTPLSDIYPKNSDQVSRMFNSSPLAHLERVKVPTLMLLGRNDLRVPHSQGLLFHKLLKSRGIETKCLVYDDVHDLQKIDVDFDCFINVAKFIEKFIF